MNLQVRGILSVLLIPLCLVANGFAQAAERKPSLAVVDFQVKGSVSERQAGEIVAGLFGTSLSDKYSIVERQQISRILEEQKFQLTDLVGDREKAARIGKLLGADFIVVGAVSQLGKTVTVEARVVNVATGEWGERGYIYCDGMDEIPKNLPALLSKMKLLGEGGLSVPVPKHVSGPLSAREDTFKGLVARGTVALNAGNPEEAQRCAEEAMQIPGFEQSDDARWLQQRARTEISIRESARAAAAKRQREYDDAVARARAALASGEFGLAVGAAESALKTLPNGGEQREEMLTLCADAKRKLDAEQQYKVAAAKTCVKFSYELDMKVSKYGDADLVAVRCIIDSFKYNEKDIYTESIVIARGRQAHTSSGKVIESGSHVVQVMCLPYCWRSPNRFYSDLNKGPSIEACTRRFDLPLGKTALVSAHFTVFEEGVTLDDLKVEIQ